jgi:uncharacterized delta-60 repeat protein
MRSWLPAAFILVGGLTVQADGDLDSSFVPNVNSTVQTIAMQPDGEILIGGFFSTVGGASYGGIARLNADGTADSNFNPGVSGTIYSFAVQADGKILVGGGFPGGIARLNADGTVDSGFLGNANTSVRSTVVQADGKVLIAGFSSGISRLNTDGTVDGSFNADVTGQITGTAVQADGKILIGGGFITVGGATHYHIARLNADGTVDSDFNPNANGSVGSIVIQPDGKILMAGGFSTVNGATCSLIARLNADGTVDSSFIDQNANISIISMALQTDGKILIVGGFTAIGGVTYTRIARLNTDGTADSSFNQSVQGAPFGIAIQTDGQILIGGPFSSVGGDASYNHMARLYNSAASQALSVPDTTRVQWLRNGTVPEVSSVTFESSTNSGVTWAALGNGTRIPGGWQLSGLSLPSSGYVRSRGRATSGYYNGSSGLIEQTGSFTNVVPPVTISAVYKGGKLVLSWPFGVLQSATAVRGPYTNVPSAVSPFTNSNMMLRQLFYRVKVH